MPCIVDWSRKGAQRWHKFQHAVLCERLQIYSKTGQWEDAVKVLDTLQAQVSTFPTIIIVVVLCHSQVRSYMP